MLVQLRLHLIQMVVSGQMDRYRQSSNAVGGTATQPEEPTRDGYEFLGWASSASATAARRQIS